MTEPNHTDTPFEGNWLIAALGDDLREHLLARGMRIPLRLGDVIARPYETIEHVYFPEAGCLSLAAKIGDGHTVEIGTTGWEGMFPISFAHGVNFTPGECTVQVEGTAWCVPRMVVEELMTQRPDFLRMLLRYSIASSYQIGLHASCNAVHTVDERLARWILMTHDRMPTNVLPLTHEFLAIMLGVRRASVSLAASIQREAGLINYTRGKIHVLDRRGLIGASCPCYLEIRKQYDIVGVKRLVDHDVPEPNQ